MNLTDMKNLNGYGMVCIVIVSTYFVYVPFALPKMPASPLAGERQLRSIIVNDFTIKGENPVCLDSVQAGDNYGFQ